MARGERGSEVCLVEARDHLFEHEAVCKELPVGGGLRLALRLEGLKLLVRRGKLVSQASGKALIAFELLCHVLCIFHSSAPD